jgi:hypothetical protein
VQGWAGRTGPYVVASGAARSGDAEGARPGAGFHGWRCGKLSELGKKKNAVNCVVVFDLIWLRLCARCLTGDARFSCAKDSLQ